MADLVDVRSIILTIISKRKFLRLIVYYKNYKYRIANTIERKLLTCVVRKWCQSMFNVIILHFTVNDSFRKPMTIIYQ